MVDPWKAVGVVVPCGVVQSSGPQVRSSRQSVRMMTTTVTIDGGGGLSQVSVSVSVRSGLGWTTHVQDRIGHRSGR